MNSFSILTINKNVDRVRRNTADKINEQIDRQIERNIRFYAAQPEDEISHRILELEQEWDIERLLQVNASTLALSGIVLSVLRGRGWLALSTGVMGFLLLHGIQGWCPPLPMLRRIGMRTRGEIDREKFALLRLRDESDVSPAKAG